MKVLSTPFEIGGRNCVIVDYTDSNYNYEELSGAFGSLIKKPEPRRKEWLLNRMAALLGEERAPNKKSTEKYKHNDRTAEENSAEKGFIFHELKELLLIEYLKFSHEEYLELFSDDLIIPDFTKKMSKEDYEKDSMYFTEILKDKEHPIDKCIKNNWQKSRDNTKDILKNKILKRIKENKLCFFDKDFAYNNRILSELFGKKSPSIDTWVNSAKDTMI